MDYSDKIVELEALRGAIARGAAGPEARGRFDDLTAALGWPPDDDAPDTALAGGAAVEAPVAPETPPAALGFLGKELTKLTCDVDLRLTHVPLALVHAFSEAQDPVATVTVTNHSQKARRLRVRSWVEGYSAASVATIELGPNAATSKLPFRAMAPILPTFFQERLDAHTHPVRATLHVEVLELGEGPGGRVEEQRTLRLWLLPRTTTVLWQTDPTTHTRRSMTKHLVSWVTPDASEVMDALRESSKHVAGNQIVSYQMLNTQVEAQVKAIFTMLKERQLAYVNSIVATGPSGAFVQRIRLPAESLRTNSSNCVDGAVLYASLLEAASLRSALVVVPGHAFVAWRSSRAVQNGAFVFGDWSFLETTMTLSGSFESAREAATATYQKLAAAAEILDVQELHAAGYLPIG